MSEITSQLAPFSTIPEDIEAEINRLLPLPADESIGAWLHELTKASGHRSTNDDMRWRLLILIWQAAEYDIDAAWPYLMWLNQGQPVMSDQLTEILTEALDDFNAHLRLAQWLAQATDNNERLATFLSEFQNLPISYKTAETFTALLETDHDPGLQPWLANYLHHTADQVSPYIRPWHLFAATWYATCFEAEAGLGYLQPFCDSQSRLSSEANHTLMTQAQQLNATGTIIQWIADCPHAAVQATLAEFGHPNLETVPTNILNSKPDYAHLAQGAARASSDAGLFKQYRHWLSEAGLQPTDPILDMACGPLAPLTHLFHSDGFQIQGADIDIPPAYLPLSGFKQRFQRSKHVKQWQAATTAYYKALAAAADVGLNRRKLRIDLVDITRLHDPGDHFGAVICCNYLHHAPDPNGLFSEVWRVLQPGGLFMLDLVPALATIEVNDQAGSLFSSRTYLNQWSAAQYRAALENARFEIIRREPSSPSDEQTTLEGRIVILAKK